jgi:hypothetical protein
MKAGHIMLPRTVISLFSIISISITLYSQTTFLTGQSNQSTPLAPGAVLQYQSDVAVNVKTRNEAFSTSWVGLGWKLGVPSITVAHNNTVDINDDRWFYDDGYGNGEEIIRVFEGNPALEKFYLKTNPFNKISVLDNNPGSGQLRVIKGWVLTSTDGTISRFGFITGQPEDALAYLPRWGNYIGKGKTGLPAPEKFYSRWYLKEVEGVNHKKTASTYTNIEAQTSTGYIYTKEIYPYKIVSPLGDTTKFVLSSVDKSVNEGPAEASLGDFDLAETKYLRQVLLKNKFNQVLNQVDLTYSGDAGEVAHLKSSQKGFAERLLTKTRFSNSKGKNQNFSYDATTGHLLSVAQTEGGATQTYTYGDKDFLLWRDLKTDFPASYWNNTNIVNVGNHVFCIYNPSGDQIELEVFDKIGNEWRRSKILGITDIFFSFGAKFYPYNDRFAINYKTDDHNLYLRILQWIDNRWQIVHASSSSSSSSIDLGKTTIKHAPSYVLKYNPNLTSSEAINVIGKEANSESWTQLASFAALNGD